MRTPDVLVLGGGGILGEAWMSAVLAGLAEEPRFDARETGHLIGTSAGSIVAAALAAGVDPRKRLGRLPEQPAVDSAPDEGSRGWGPLPGAPGARSLSLVAGAAGAAVAPFAGLALRSSAPGGRLLRSAALGRAPVGTRSLAMLRDEVAALGPAWDRLRISAVDMDSGARVMFGSPEAPRISVAEAVQASCAIPGVFRPVQSGGRRYVDGGAWSPTNMDTADITDGMHVLCLNPTGSMRPSRSSLAGAMGPVSRSVAAIEAATLRHRGATVAVISPDSDSQASMGPSLMDPGPRAEVVAGGLAQGRELSRDGT